MNKRKPFALRIMYLPWSEDHVLYEEKKEKEPLRNLLFGTRGK